MKLDKVSHTARTSNCACVFYTKLNFAGAEINLLSSPLRVHQLLCRTNNIRDFDRAESGGKETKTFVWMSFVCWAYAT